MVVSFFITPTGGGETGSPPPKSGGFINDGCGYFGGGGTGPPHNVLEYLGGGRTGLPPHTVRCALHAYGPRITMS